MWQTQVELVGPNKLGHLLSRTPSDPEYPIHQYSLSNMIGMPTAWDYEVGKYSVKVGIVDNGLDFHHCDLGAAFGVGSKVSGGYYYADQSTNIDIECVHGTLVAGVIGALTNRDNCGAAAPTGVAGIGGGWGTNNGYPDQLIGLQLIGLKVSPIGKEELVDLSSAIAAIREGSANYVDHTHGIAHAFGVDVLNNSWSVFALADENLRSAVNYAFQNGVSFVAGTGNHYLHDPVVDYYPASYDPDWVVAVGAEDHNGNPEWYTQECSKTDLLGPGGDHSNPADIIVWSTMPGGTYGVLDGTSAATPHVSGVLGLLRSKTKSLPWASRLETEDYEGILKASSVSYNFNQVLPTSWNDPKGWGNLHADQLFQMLDPDHFNVIPWSNYQLVHFSDNWNPKYGAWIDATNETFHLGGKQSTKNPADYTYTNGVQYRSVDFTKTLTTGEWNDYWDLTQPVFAWGTSGAGDPDNGWELGNPNYETGFTQITNGEGGNSNNDGIIHTSNSTFNLRTYQWRKEKGGSAYDYYPCEGTSISGHFIRYNFSVYGRALVHADGVAVSKDELGTFNLQLFPTSANSHVNVSYTLDRSSIRQLSILDVLGREVLSVPPETRYSGSQIERFEISKLPDGMYTCRVTSCGKIASARFLVGH
ncbi:MAG: S8 family serine peptidase [Candidatus Kapaibacterium sp.]